MGADDGSVQLPEAQVEGGGHEADLSQPNANHEFDQQQQHHHDHDHRKCHHSPVQQRSNLARADPGAQAGGLPDAGQLSAAAVRRREAQHPLQQGGAGQVQRERAQPAAGANARHQDLNNRNRK